MKVIFFTGAGISADAGVPIFQGTDIRKKIYRRYALWHPVDFKNTIREGLNIIADKEPTAAHRAIADLGCPVITMNVDGLHQKAGSREVLQVHGEMPTERLLDKWYYPLIIGKPVLYGDPAPRYYKAFYMIKSLKPGDYLVIVGTSFYTQISTAIKKMAEKRGAEVIIINEDASIKVPELCQKLKWK